MITELDYDDGYKCMNAPVTCDTGPKGLNVC